MDISIVIPTWNNSQRLRITLESFCSVHIPSGINWEIVLVNNNCSDNTDEIVESYLTKLPIIYVKEPRPGTSKAKNKGLEMARSQSLVVFCDDDIEMCTQWLETYWNAYEQRPYGFFFGGPVSSEFEKLVIDEDLLPLTPPSVKGFDLGPLPKVLNGEFLLGANWAAPIDIVRILKGFDEDKGLNASANRVKTGEETDLMSRLKRAGWKAYYLPQARVKHFVPSRKCTLDHTVVRIKAWGYYQALEYSKYIKPNAPRINGVPLGIYKRIVIQWLIWVGQKIQVRKAYREYLDIQESLGIMDGIQEQRNTPANV